MSDDFYRHQPNLIYKIKKLCPPEVYLFEAAVSPSVKEALLLVLSSHFVSELYSFLSPIPVHQNGKKK